MDRSQRGGFTLIELIVVIGVVAILTALTIAAMGGVNNSAARYRAASELSGISAALGSYKTDNAIFPDVKILAGTDPEPDPDPTTYRVAGQLLFVALMGANNLNSTTRTGPVYMQGVNKTMVSTSDGTHYFIDPWGFPYGYRSLDASNLTGEGFNMGFFDLWSTGGGNSADPEDLNAWIVNWSDPAYDRKIVE